MKINNTTVLIVPGWLNSGADHWQTIWENAHDDWRRVEQDNWEYPELECWVMKLNSAIMKCSAPPLLISHSLGALTVTKWAASQPKTMVAGALLVAPPDVEDPNIPDEISSFAPVPLKPLPFLSVLVASQNDTYLSFERAVYFAKAWGAEFYDAGASGHINSEAGFGDWTEGERLVARLLENHC